MRFHPPSLKRDYYLGLLQSILGREWPSNVRLAGAGNAGHELGDPALWVDADARINLVLRGCSRYAVSSLGTRSHCELKPGQALYWPPHAWNIPFWDSPCFLFGVVFRSTFTRYLVVDYSGGPAPVSNTPWAWHTRRPIGGAGIHMVRALNALALEQDYDPVQARRLVLGLLHCAERHLAMDGGEDDGGKARRTWQMALEYLNRHYADIMLSRESVAASIGVHPNYLSAIAAQHGEGFHATMEKIRIDRARHLLNGKACALDEIAKQCGYSGTISFSRAFRRVTGMTPGTLRATLQSKRKN